MARYFIVREIAWRRLDHARREAEELDELPRTETLQVFAKGDARQSIREVLADEYEGVVPVSFRFERISRFAFLQRLESFCKRHPRYPRGVWTRGLVV